MLPLWLNPVQTIQRKLQKLEGFTGMNATQLLEVANKVFMNQDHEAQREADKKNETESSPAISSTEELRSSEIDCSLMERGNQEETPTMP